MAQVTPATRRGGNTFMASLRDEVATLAEEAERLRREFDHYWSPEGENVSQLEIFIDPDLYTYIHRMYTKTQDFLARVAALKEHLDDL